MNVVAFAGEVATIPPGRKGKKELIIHFERLKKMGGKKQTQTWLTGHSGQNSGNHLQEVKKSHEHGRVWRKKGRKG